MPNAPQITRPVARHWQAPGDAEGAEVLTKRGVIEIWPETGMCRLKPQN